MADIDYRELIDRAVQVAELAPEGFRSVTYEVVFRDLLKNMAPSLSKGKDVPLAGDTLGKGTMSPAEFLRKVKPDGGLQTLIALCYYLDNYLRETSFTQKRLRELAVAAKIKDIHPQYFTRGVREGMLADAGDRAYRLTQSGEDLVVSLLDRPVDR